MARVNARIGHAKEDLRVGIRRIKAAVTKNKKRLSKQEIEMYKKTISQMEEARKKLQAIWCIQPAMSFDIPRKYSRPKPAPRGGRSRKKK